MKRKGLPVVSIWMRDVQPRIRNDGQLVLVNTHTYIYMFGDG